MVPFCEMIDRATKAITKRIKRKRSDFSFLVLFKGSIERHKRKDEAMLEGKIFDFLCVFLKKLQFATGIVTFLEVYLSTIVSF